MAKIFDWSIVDREILALMIKMAEPTIVGMSLQPTDISKKIKKIFKFFDLPVKIRTIYNQITTPNTVWVGGLYDSNLDEESKTSITVITQFNNKNKDVVLNKCMFNRMCYAIADTILHEIIHVRQYRRRSYKVIPGYLSTASSGKKHTQQEYLGHPDEIDAYSFNIACQLIERFGDNDNLISKYLNADFTDKRLRKDTYKMYLQAFDHNHKHTVIRRLKKKIVYYLPNAREIGKPYKTNDWLKK